MKKELNILLVASTVWCAGIIAAPLLVGTSFSDILYYWYSFICHQFESSSFQLHDHPFAVCIRCSAIYGAFFLSLIALRRSVRLRKMQFRPILLLMVTALPMALDGTAALFNISEATTFSRILTGSLFGAGMALLLHTVLCESIRSFIFKNFRPYEHTAG